MPDNATQGGCAFRGRRDDLWYLEQLPPSARQALYDAAFDWAAGWVYTRWKRGTPGFKTGPEVAARIAEADAQQIAKDRRRVWGIE